MNQQKYSRVALMTTGIIIVIVSVAAGYQWATHTMQPNHTTENATSHKEGDRKVLYWYDPMEPKQHFDKPGKSPYMDMELLPKYAAESADENVAENSGIRIDANVQQNLGIRLANVENRSLATSIDAVGTVAFNRRELAVVQARTNGFVSRVYARAPGDVIVRGAPLVDLLVPEWVAAQQEFIALRVHGDANLVNAARERLRLLGMSNELIKKIERSNSPQTSVTISSPQSGVIQTLNVRTGVTVSIGMTLAEINGLDSVWLNAAVPEALAQQIVVGDTLQASFPALANKIITGKVIAILPETNADSRTVTVRAQLPNTDGQLRPGQFSRIALLRAQSGNALTIPSEAIIRTGTRNVVIAIENSRFIPVEVQTGREAEGRTEILKGLREGEHVVVSGQFLIDSEANLTGVLSRMAHDANSQPAGDRP